MIPLLLEGGGALLQEGGGALLLEGESVDVAPFFALGDASDRQTASVAVLDRDVVDAEVSARDSDVVSPQVDPFAGYRGIIRPSDGPIVETSER